MKTGSGSDSQEARPLAQLRKLTPARRKALIEYVELLVAESAAGRAERPSSIPRPAGEIVVQAIRRLTHTYPLIERAVIMSAVSRRT